MGFAESLTAARKRRRAMESGSRPRVLVVDDSVDVADSTAELLRLTGFDARACYDGPAALAVAAEFLPDVSLLDLTMPLMDGDELAVRLRKQAAGRPMLLVAVTAMGGDEYRRRTEAAGFHLHLLKPVDPHDLLRVVDELWPMMHAAGHPAKCDGSNG
jgi:two-component system, OmpR family, response regulator